MVMQSTLMKQRNFIKWDESTHQVAVLPEAESGELDETAVGGETEPASLVLQRFGQVPVVQRHHGLDALPA